IMASTNNTPDEADDDIIIDMPDIIDLPATAPRYPVDLRIIWDNGAKCASGPAVNLSLSGIYIKTGEAPPIGKEVRLMPMINGQNTDLVLNGKVVRVGDTPATGMGVQFTPRTRAEKRQLEKFVEMYAARASGPQR